MATLSDVAKHAGVSVSAVSRVLSQAHDSRVSAGTRQRILDAAEDLNYRPNFAGRALKSARTQVLGLVVPDLTNALFTELMDGFEDEARERGYVILLGRAEQASAGGEIYERLIGEGRVDGLVIQVGDGVQPAGLSDLLTKRDPVVLINSTQPGEVGSVLLNDQEGARLATQHLLDLGHERIAFANGLPQSLTADRRREGVVDALTRAGRRLDERMETRIGYRPAQGAEALRELWAREVRPTGVVVANVNAAVGLVAEARRLGIRVPEDLSVVTIHDSWTAENSGPPLTAVRMQFYAMGRTAARDLVERISTGTMRDVVITEPAPELVVRESSAAPGASWSNV